MRVPGEIASDAPGPSHRAVIAVCIAVGVVGVNTTAVSVASRGIADELGISLRGLEAIMAAYLVTAAAFALAGGRLGDVIGRTRTFMIGCLTFAVAGGLAALAPGDTVLIVARAIQGVGAALVMPASIEVIAAYAPARGPQPGFRSRGVVYASAFGIGPLIGGVLTDNISWRAVFWAEVAALVVAMVVALPLFAAPSRFTKVPTRDFLGATLVAVLIFDTVLLASRASGWGFVLWPTGGLTLLAAVLLVWLVRVESATDHPLIHSGLLRDRTVVGANVATLGASIGMVGLIYFFNVFAQSSAVFDSTALGVAFAVVPFTVSIIVFSFVAEFLSRHFGVTGPVIGGLGLSVVGFAMLARIAAGTTETQLVIPLVLCGIGAGIANAALTAPAVLTEQRRLDEAAGLISLTRFLGSAIAVAIGTASYLSVTVGSRADTGDPAEIALGGTAYQRAVAALRVDLRQPFQAAAKESTVQAFAATMRLAALTLLILAIISAVLLARPARAHDDPPTPAAE